MLEDVLLGVVRLRYVNKGGEIVLSDMDAKKAVEMWSKLHPKFGLSMYIHLRKKTTDYDKEIVSFVDVAVEYKTQKKTTRSSPL